MDLTTYRLIHFGGIMLLYLGLGVLFFSPRKPEEKPPKAAAILHGVGLLVILVAGFGLKARLGLTEWPSWIILKLVIWVTLGALPTLVKKRILPGLIGFLLALALGVAAAYLGMLKP